MTDRSLSMPGGYYHGKPGGCGFRDNGAAPAAVVPNGPAQTHRVNDVVLHAHVLGLVASNLAIQVWVPTLGALDVVLCTSIVWRGNVCRSGPAVVNSATINCLQGSCPWTHPKRLGVLQYKPRATPVTDLRIYVPNQDTCLRGQRPEKRVWHAKQLC